MSADKPKRGDLILLTYRGARRTAEVAGQGPYVLEVTVHPLDGSGVFRDALTPSQVESMDVRVIGRVDNLLKDLARAAGLPMEHNGPDLYLPDCSDSWAIARLNPFSDDIRPFRHPVHQAWWLDIPFGYDPLLILDEPSGLREQAQEASK